VTKSERGFDVNERGIVASHIEVLGVVCTSYIFLGLFFQKKGVGNDEGETFGWGRKRGEVVERV